MCVCLCELYTCRFVRMRNALVPIHMHVYLTSQHSPLIFQTKLVSSRCAIPIQWLLTAVKFTCKTKFHGNTNSVLVHRSLPQPIVPHAALAHARTRERSWFLRGSARCWCTGGLRICRPFGGLPRLGCSCTRLGRSWCSRCPISGTGLGSEWKPSAHLDADQVCAHVHNSARLYTDAS